MGRNQRNIYSGAVLLVLLTGCASSGGDEKPQPDPIAEQNARLERERQKDKDDFREGQRKKVLDRAKATTIPEGAKDISEAEAAKFEGKFCGIANTNHGGAPEGGGVLLGIESAREPFATKAIVAFLPDGLNVDGVTGELIDKCALVVTLRPPFGRHANPVIMELQVLKSNQAPPR